MPKLFRFIGAVLWWSTLGGGGMFVDGLPSRNFLLLSRRAKRVKTNSRVINVQSWKSVCLRFRRDLKNHREKEEDQLWRGLVLWLARANIVHRERSSSTSISAVARHARRHHCSARLFVLVIFIAAVAAFAGSRSRTVDPTKIVAA